MTAVGPNWDRLYELASGQEGYFTTQDATSAGFSSQLLLKHISAGRVMRARGAASTASSISLQASMKNS